MMNDQQTMAIIQALMQKRDAAGTSPDAMPLTAPAAAPMMPQGGGSAGSIPGLALGGQDQAQAIQMMGGGGPLPGGVPAKGWLDMTEGPNVTNGQMGGLGSPGLGNISPQDLQSLMQMLGR